MNKFKLCKVVVSILCTVIPVALLYIFSNDLYNLLMWSKDIAKLIASNSIIGFISGGVGSLTIYYLFTSNIKRDLLVIATLSMSMILYSISFVSWVLNENSWIISSIFIAFISVIIYEEGAFGVCKFLKRNEETDEGETGEGDVAQISD